MDRCSASGSQSSALDKIIIERLAVHGIVGARKRERTKPQPLYLTIALYTTFLPPNDPNSDELANTIDYSILSRELYSFVANKKAKLLEHLAVSVADFLFSLDDRITKVDVKIQKPNAITMADAAAVSIHRVRSDFVSRQPPPKHSPLQQPFDTDETSEEIIIALGSNIGERARNIQSAIERIEAFAKVEKVSFLYETKPRYNVEQPLFYNAAIKIRTPLEPMELLHRLKEIEKSLGRDFNQPRNAPRTIDLDIIFYGQRSILLSTLVIPHPQMHERDFVIGPLMDICPSFFHVLRGQTVGQMWLTLNKCSEIVKVTPTYRPNGEEYLPLKFHANEKTKIMGVLNVTPDSFSGGTMQSTTSLPIDEYVAMVKKWHDNNAVDIVDIGGESTRPGAEEIPVEEELARVIPVIKAIRQQEWADELLISIDTRKGQVAEAALAAGANIINDISGGTFDPSILDVSKRTRAPVILTHSRGTPETMSQLASYPSSGDQLSAPSEQSSSPLIVTVVEELSERVSFALNKARLFPWQVIVDPGIGFAKKLPQNVEILSKLSEWRERMGTFPVITGPSRKGFISILTHRPAPETQYGTAAAIAACIANGSDIVRVHDVIEMKQVALVADAIFKQHLPMKKL